MLFTLGEELGDNGDGVDEVGDGIEFPSGCATGWLATVSASSSARSVVDVVRGEHGAPTRTAATAGDNDEGVELGEGIDALIDGDEEVSTGWVSSAGRPVPPRTSAASLASRTTSRRQARGLVVGRQSKTASAAPFAAGTRQLPPHFGQKAQAVLPFQSQSKQYTIPMG